MRHVIEKVFVISIKLLYRQTILLLALLFIGGVSIALWNMSSLSDSLIETQALQNATLYAQAITESRTLYSSDVVSRINPIEGITVTHNYTMKEGAIPLPATFLIELGERIRENNPGVSVRLYSDYPFPWRRVEGGPKDEFERRALNYLKQFPDENFTRIEQFQGRTSFRYAQADVMKPSCIGCHNTHPDTPKRDWKVGDVRGIVEITQPLDGIVEQTHRRLRNTLVMLASISGLGVAGIALVIGRLRQTSAELERRVLERTAQLQQSNEDLADEREKSERLLLNILPPTIAAQLKEKPSNIAHGFPEVTILFADITNFTPLSAGVTPIELVKLLNEIFSSFDRLTEQYGLEKIKTIGDAYMVVGGLPIPREDHAEAIAEMALEMQAEIARFRLDPTFSVETLQIRIGINTGAVVAGVIGLKKFIYDLWGDAVNVAARMESAGIPGKIQVGQATYELLKDRYILEERGAIAVKGKGMMRTYWLVGRKSTALSIRTELTDY
jgi:adenylate cyclase